MKKEHIGFEIKLASKLITRAMGNMEAMECANEMTGTHAWILRYLYENRDKEMFQRDIEKQMNIRRSSATGLLKLMEKNGLIYREPVDYDARLKRIVMTEKAVALHNSIDRDIENMEKRISKGLSEEEEKMLLSLLRRVQKNLQDETEK